MVFNLKKRKTGVPIKSRRSEKPDITMLVRSVAKDTAISSRGVQAIHAEVMRRLASVGSVEFVNYAEVRTIYEHLTKKSRPPLQKGQVGRRREKAPPARQRIVG